jgi:hypothetical protein
VLERDLGAHRGEALEVLVDRAGADRAAAGQRHAAVAVARDQRPEDEHAGAHRLDQLVRRLVVALAARRLRRRLDPAQVLGRLGVDLAAEVAQQLAHRRDVLQPRDVAEGRGARGQERRGQQGERGVLGAADLDLPGEARASFDDDLVHDFRGGVTTVAAARER